MEEVDSIILHFLRQLNISIDDEVKNLCDLPVEIIIESASRCIKKIIPSLKVPSKMPGGISQRIEVAAQIASLCKDLGYNNDVGYQTFLYYNEEELRHVFMFLIERLPNESKETTKLTKTSSKKSILLHNISNRIAEDLNVIWIPPCCSSSNRTIIGDKSETPKPNKIYEIYNEEGLIRKLIKLKNGTQNHSDILYPTSECKDSETANEILNETVEQLHILEYDKNLKELKEMSLLLRQKLDMLESDKNLMDVEHSQIKKSCEMVESDFKNVQSILKSIGLTEYEDGDNILENVQANIAALHRKSENMMSKNLSLKLEIDKVKNTLALSESERIQCKKQLLGLKETIKLMKVEYEKKEELRNHHKKQLEKIRGGNKRSIYTKRILEIISNVDKQNIEITKILEDTRQLQKDINNLEGQLDRCFSIADETLFRDAKKDDQAKKAYKLLALLHSECNTIVSLVNETGSFARDIVDLEDNIKSEKAKRTEDTLQKIQLDLTKLQEEIV